MQFQCGYHIEMPNYGISAYLGFLFFRLNPFKTILILCRRQKMRIRYGEPPCPVRSSPRISGDRADIFCVSALGLCCGNQLNTTFEPIPHYTIDSHLYLSKGDNRPKHIYNMNNDLAKKEAWANASTRPTLLNCRINNYCLIPIIYTGVLSIW